MNPNEKISFDIVSIYDGNSVRTLDLLVTEKNGNTTFIDSYGGLHHRKLQKGEVPFSYLVNAQESYVKKNGDTAIRVFATISYWPEQYEGQLEEGERVANIIARHAHDLIKRHEAVIVRDANGGNINPNQSGMVLFELRESTKIVNDKVEKNKNVSSAMAIATDLYENDQPAFIDLCYRYSIQPVEGVPIQKLYNEVVLKLQNNPEHFMEILNHKDAKLLVLIKKAMISTSEEPAIITFEDPFYFMAGVNLGKTEEEIIYNLNKSAKDRELLYQLLGLPAEDIVEIVNLPAESEAIVTTAKSQDYQRRTDEARVQEAKKVLNAVFTRWQTDANKNPAGGAELRKKYMDKLAENREKFIDIADLWDADVANRMKYIK